MRAFNTAIALFLGAISIGLFATTVFFLFRQADLLSCMVGVGECTDAFIERTPSNEALSATSDQLSLVGTTVNGITTIATILLSSTVTLIISFFIFIAVTSRQLDVFDQNKELARLGALREREREFLELFEEKLAAFPKNESQNLLHLNSAPLDPNHLIQYPTRQNWQNFRSSIGETPWDIYDKFSGINSKELHRIIEGTNLVLVSASGLRVSSKALHETLMWFRNIQRAYDAGFVRDDDLRNMWRQTLPFTWSRRFVFFTKYFTEQDTMAMRSICAVTHRLIWNENKETLDKPDRYIDQEFVDFESRFRSSRNRKLNSFGKLVGTSPLDG